MLMLDQLQIIVLACNIYIGNEGLSTPSYNQKKCIRQVVDCAERKANTGHANVYNPSVKELTDCIVDPSK